MLSFKVAYAVQILDLLRQSKEAMSITSIRDHFVFLPSTSFISGIVRQLDSGRLICNTLPSGGISRYCIMVSLSEITLADLSRIVDDELVLGSPVGLRYWGPGYLIKYPHIKVVEQQLESQVTNYMTSITIEKLLAEQQEHETHKTRQGSAKSKISQHI